MVTGDKNAPDATHPTSADNPDPLPDGWPDTMPSGPAPLHAQPRTR
jgi:hypothetical protein